MAELLVAEDEPLILVEQDQGVRHGGHCFGKASLRRLDARYVSVGADNPRHPTVGVELDRLAAAEDPHPVTVAMAFAILELMVGDLAGGETPFFLARVITILRMDPREPTLLRVSYGSVCIDAAHDLPHPGIKRRARPKVVIPYPLPGAFQREVPAAFGFRDRVVGLLLSVDVDDLDNQ